MSWAVTRPRALAGSRAMRSSDRRRRRASISVEWMVEAPRQILNPLYCGGLWLAVTMTPAFRPSFFTAK